ncbi:UNVERIFIED_CONTAM: hypothetical protein FKN15_030237 [Acipenser sinensis]
MDGDARKEQPHRFKWASSSLRLKSESSAVSLLSCPRSLSEARCKRSQIYRHKGLIDALEQIAVEHPERSVDQLVCGNVSHAYQ